jgi:hypothetical protein
MADPLEELLRNYRPSDIRPAARRPTAAASVPSSITAGPAGVNFSTVRVNLDLPGPPVKVWGRGGWVQAKCGISGNLQIRVVDGGDIDTTVGTSVGVSLQRSLNDKLALSGDFDLNMLDLGDEVERGDVRGFGRKVLDGLSVGAKWNLPSGLDATVGVGYDEDFCFFRTAVNTSRLALSLPLPGTRSGFEVQFPGSVELRFGPTPRAWLQLARRFGLPLVRRLMISLVRLASSTAPEVAVTGLELSFAAWAGIVLAAVEGGLAMQDLTNWICDRARAEGLQMGMENLFAMAYVQTVYYGQPQYTSPIGSQVAVQNRGYRRANQDMQQHGADSIRRSLERHFNHGRRVQVAGRSAVDPAVVNTIGERFGLELTRRRRGY